jgi:acetyltransferase-like isoleucine patch superfamily enzyme
MKLSIVTITYNCISTIENTLKSLVTQKYKDFEYIIIDGGSNDGTLDVINKYSAIISKILSEPDDGIYDAINKGINVASGELIGLLHSGDTYSKDTLLIVNEYHKLNKNRIIYGDTFFINDVNELIGSQHGRFETQSLNSGFGFMHPSTFVPKNIYKLVGSYDTNYKYAGDVDFFIRAYKKGINFSHSPHKVYMKSDGTSERNFKAAKLDYFRVLKAHNMISEFNLIKTKFRFILKYYLLKKYIQREQVYKFKLQSKYFLVWLHNLIYNCVPFFKIKNTYLRVTKTNIGANSYIHSKVKFLSVGKLFVGDNVVINNDCLIDNRGEITIGNNVSVASSTKIYTTGHDIDGPYFEGKRKNVSIEDYCVIFSSCLIMPGVTLAIGTVVLPGSVVTKSTEPYSIVGGNPAIRINSRSNDLRYSLNHGYWFSS